MSKYSEKKERQAREEAEQAERERLEESNRKVGVNLKRKEHKEQGDKSVCYWKLSARDLCYRCRTIAKVLRNAGMDETSNAFLELCNRYERWITI